MQNAVHFVGFVHPAQGKDARYDNAVRVFGQPDFVHRYWDQRAVAEIADGDTVVFSNGKKAVFGTEPMPNAFDDSNIGVLEFENAHPTNDGL